MKQLAFLLLTFLALSCSKEKETSTVIGSWQLQERIEDTGGRIQTTAVSAANTALVAFKSNGTITVERAANNPFLEHLVLFTHYKTAGDGVIEFYTPGSGQTLKAWFSVSNQLLLQYEARCYFAEKFIRKN